jgi:uncharacterized protein YwqG
MSDEHLEKYRKELNTLNLETVDDLERLVKPLIKEATRIIVKKSSKMPENSHTKSHFGGQPYFEKGEKWPKAKNGNYLEFVFQIYNENNIVLPENIKLIQFYYDFDAFPWNTNDDGWLVKIYTNINKENVEIIEKPKEHDKVNYCEVEYENIKSLPDWEGMENYDVNAKILSCELNEEDPWENYEKIVEKLVGEPETRSQLGGYPLWIQGNEQPDSDLLFQIDSEENAGLMWGDAGLIYVFYNDKNNKIEFVLQCY